MLEAVFIYEDVLRIKHDGAPVMSPPARVTDIRARQRQATGPYAAF